MELPKEHYPLLEQITNVLTLQTQSSDPLFFRVMTSFYLSFVASTMRIKVNTPDRGVIPVNFYGLCLAPSGFGKNLSANIVEEQVIHKFKERFKEEVEPEVIEVELARLAQKRASKAGVDPDDELVKVLREFQECGESLWSFDSGTIPAFKQQHHRALMTNTRALTFICDEIGCNFTEASDLLKVFLETFDKGKIKQKLIKNTIQSVRNAEIEGSVPTNMLLFGTPTKLIDGGTIEASLLSFLDTGYARRLFFGSSDKIKSTERPSAEELFNQMTNGNSVQVLEDIADKLELLADSSNMSKELTLTRESAIYLLEYKLHCEDIAATLGDHDEIRKAEITHRYFKVLKVAGAFAFVDFQDEVSIKYIKYGIALAEESGEAFNKILNRERNYVKLAKYLANKTKITQVDLVEDLPFYRKSDSQKRELMNLAIAWGYQNSIIIKKEYTSGIEFLSGEALKEIDLQQCILSYSEDMAYGYDGVYAPFNELHNLTQEEGLHWCNHMFKDNHRNDENTIEGFNLLVFDVDGTATLNEVRTLLKNYTYHLYTTKRHTESSHRFRIVMPLSHVLKLSLAEYKEFYDNILEWLPFKVDEQTSQRSRKWLSNKGINEYNEGKLLDVLPFIPRTFKNEERKKSLEGLENLTNLERWFIDNTGTGNRSNQLIKYAFMLVDSGRSYEEVQAAICSLNEKIADKLDDTELYSTILVSAAKAIAKRDAGV